jgi:hypothetical protein
LAKTRGPLHSSGASGGFGKSLIFQTWKGQPRIKSFTPPRQPRTPAQLSARLIQSQAVQRWRQLSSLMQGVWEQYKDAKHLRMSGYNYFISEYNSSMFLGNTPSDYPPGYPIGKEHIFNTEVAVSYDDACERGNGGFNLTDGDMYISSNANPSSWEYRCGGLRFVNIPIPKNAQVLESWIEVYPLGEANDDVNCKIYGQATDHPANFNDNKHIISEVYRPRTSAYTSWVADEIGYGAWKKSPSLNSVLQEILCREGWADGNSLVILIIANTDVEKWLRVYTYDYWQHWGAKLHIKSLY